MKARQCAGCAAPLPASAPGETVTCRFCGMGHDPVAGQPAAVHVEIGHPRQVKVSGGKLALLLAVIGALVLIPAAIGLYVAYRAADTAVRTVGSIAGPPHTPPKTTFTTANLRDLPPGYQDLEVAAPAGGYAAFDLVRELPWAVTIAQAWAADARLTRVDAERLRPDGTVNLADDREAQARYRFASPSRIAELRKQADLSASAEAPTEFWVQVKAAGVKALAVRNSARTLRDDTLPAHPRSLAMTALWKSLSARPGFDAPFYSGYLIHLEREGWVWYFSTLGGTSLPRVRAQDGRSWPY